MGANTAKTREFVEGFLWISDYGCGTLRDIIKHDDIDELELPEKGTYIRGSKEENGYLSDLDGINNPWSPREILCFSCIMVIAVIMMIYLIRKEKMNKLQAAAILAELVFLGIVFGSTVFTRTGSVRQYELIPFWSWSAILRYHDMQLLKENLLNCILLLPAGALLPLIMNRKIKWQEALLFGVLISATIETSQLITMRGLFEWDDMIHNGLGCMVGNWLCHMIRSLKMHI